MSQSTFLREFDAMAAAAFAYIGMADAATYTAPTGGSAVPCTALVDRGAQDFGGGDLVVEGQRVLITLFFAQVPAPIHGGVVTITASGETFTLNREDARDESRTRWVVLA